MQELCRSELAHVSGAVQKTESLPADQLAEDMRELLAYSDKNSLAVNKTIRVINRLFGCKIKYR